MEKILQNFIKALRSSGLRISVSESIDAMGTASLMGYGNRSVFKDSLAAVLAKSQPEKEMFHDCFDRFFSPATFPENQTKITKPSQMVSTDRDHGLTRLLLEKNNAQLSALIMEAAQSVNVDKISFFTQKGLYIRRIMLKMGMESLNMDISRRMIKGNFFNPQEGEMLKGAKALLFEKVRNHVEKQLSLFSGSTTRRLVENYLKDIKLSNLEMGDYTQMQVLIKKMVKRLNDLHSRRKKLSTRGFLDIKKTLRANMAYDGILVYPRWKKKKIDRPNLAVLCDVSRSVETVVRFMLLFLYGLNDSLVKMNSYIFCSNLVEVSHIFKKHELAQALAILQKGDGVGIDYNGTDYGRAFKDFAGKPLGKVTNKTTVLILGDARNNYGDPGTGILRTIKEKSKRIIWLNPEPQSLWGTGDSEIKKYSPYCFFVRECSTLRHLQRVIDYLLKTD